MPHFHIVKNIDIDESFRVSRVKSDFDVKNEHLTRVFEGDFNIPEKWQVGLIVGNSGTGKTTIMNQLFGGDNCSKVQFSRKSVIDDMPNVPVDDITKMFYAVGFGSVPCWLKPFDVLSNGEKMRVTLAKALLSNDFCVFDEFTSVVDRNVAQTMCIALRKCLDKYPNKRFVAVTCHKDVEAYLQPDWVFNTDTMTMSFPSAHVPLRNSPSEDATKKSGQNLGIIII